MMTTPLTRIGAGLVSAAIGVALLVTTATVRAEAPGKPSSAVVVHGTRLTFDPSTCTEGQGGFWWALGSVRVTVLGHETGKCVFNYQWEVEGGGSYQVHRVKVSTNGGPVVIDAAREHKSDSNHWSYIYTSFTKTQAQLVRECAWGWLSDLVEGTDAFVAQRRSMPGNGPAAGPGDRLSLRFMVYQDTNFEQVAVGAKQRQTVEFKPGAANAWKWIEPAAVGMAVGEKRQLKLPMKVAEGARDWVPDTKLVETLHLEMELVSLEPTKVVTPAK